MTGKAKPTKHSAREVAKKTHDATVNRGGGAAGLKDRLGGETGHTKFMCPICKTPANDLKTMQNHHESKHPGVPFDATQYQDLHAATGGVTTQGVAVRGSVKKK